VLGGDATIDSASDIRGEWSRSIIFASDADPLPDFGYVCEEVEGLKRDAARDAILRLVRDKPH
jgi:hypothetical protein